MVVKSATTSESVRELKVVVKSAQATTSATTCGCIHWTYIFYSLEQAPGTEAHLSSEAASSLSTWWYPQQPGLVQFQGSLGRVPEAAGSLSSLNPGHGFFLTQGK